MGPGNTVDIGIFDPRGREFLDAAGFRGWSGASKREFFIAPQEATPGYIRGPLYPGDWHVVLGVERVNPEGVRYEVSVNLTLDERDPPPAYEPASAADPPPARSGRAPPPLPITLIPGEEVTTYWGHANMWGLREWIDFRCADSESMQAVQRFVLQKGGLISVNHPKSIGPPWLFEGWSGYPCME